MADDTTEQDQQQEVDQEQAGEPTDAGAEGEQDDREDQDEPETFPRPVVEQLRKEAAEARTRANDATKERDTLARRLHEALTAATGRLEDPTDLPFDLEHLDDPEKLTAAIDALLERKPHLASRRPRGSVGQGETGTPGTVNLADLLRSRA